MADKKAQRVVAENRKAYHDYFVDERYEAGIELFGTEVKSIRCGQANLKDSYCEVREGQLYAVGFRISPYEKGNIFNRDPMREKRLLMHKREIMKLHGLVSQKGYTLIPLRLYFVGPRLKMEIGLCRGKKLYDKRDSEAKKEANREIERSFRSNAKYD